MPSYLDPSTIEWCDRCRCKTWHLVDAQTGERRCEWTEQHAALDRRSSSLVIEDYADEGTRYDAPIGGAR